MVSKNLSARLSVCLSACLFVMNFDHNYLRTGETEWVEILLGYLCQKVISQKFYFSQQGAGMAWAEGQKHVKT